MLKFNELMWPCLEAIRALGGSATNAEIEEKVAKLLKFSEETLNKVQRPGMSVFQYRLAWARSYLKAAGAINNSERGVWAITPDGTTVEEKDIPKLVSLARTNSHEKTARKGSNKGQNADDDQLEDSDSSEWKEQLLLCLQEMTPNAFERLCQQVLREAGFIEVDVTGRSGDGGIDGFGVLRINLLSFRVIFQCKRWKGSVGPDVVRDFRGAMQGRAEKGLIITTATFSSSAKAEARRDGASPVDLIDGASLCDLLKAFKMGVQTQTTENVTINRVWFSQNFK